MTLDELKTGETGVIVKVKGRGAFRKRITDMGFVKGKRVDVIKNAPLKDPVEYKILDYKISLRRSEAMLIEVVIIDSKDEYINQSGFYGLLNDSALKHSFRKKSNTIHVALVGNPNSGKTTLFNFMSGENERVGNYAGVTVDSKKAIFNKNGYTFHITDLPGTYSLSAYTPEELYVRHHILDEIPDVIVNIVDASNLERNLYLTTQLIDMDVKVVMALNMFDELMQSGTTFNYDYLGKMLGIPMLPTVASTGKGIDLLFAKIIDVYEDRDKTVQHIHINYGEEVEESIKEIQQLIQSNSEVSDFYSARFYAIKLLEKDNHANAFLRTLNNYEAIKTNVAAKVEWMEDLLHDDSETLIADARYGLISGALKETMKKGKPKEAKTNTEKIDHWLTHHLLGFPIFLLFLWIMFQSTFTLGSYPMNWIDSGVGALSNLMSMILPQGIFRDFVVDALVGGIGGVIIFLPNILILFFFIALMENTGYMARIAFIMDKLMHLIGLHGRSFIPLIMGFGCNVPAVMATRTIKNRGDRILTMMIIPFMSCSARLPVYILLAGAFFPTNAANVILSIYFIGILLSILVALLLKRTLLKLNETPFVMELPPYRMPTFRAIVRQMWFKTEHYIKKIGGVILIASVLIWVLGYFPRNTKLLEKYDVMIEQANAQFNLQKSNLQISDSLTFNALQREQNNQIAKIEIAKAGEQQAKSFIGIIGHAIEPVIAPLGFDWKIGISLLTGAAAKEVVVSTMGVLYQAGEDDSEMLTEKLQTQRYQSGKKRGELVFNKLVAFNLMLFVLIYMPCIGVISAVRREAESWRWGGFMVLYTTALAWFLCFVVYQLGVLFI